MKAAVLISKDAETGSCVVGVPNRQGGLTELALDPPYSNPKFLPDVGEELLLQMDGPVPTVFPRTLAVDSVGLAEVVFGTVTALLLAGDEIVAGDPEGNHVVLDNAGVRLYRDGVDVVIDLQTLTGSGLFTGDLQTEANGARITIHPGDDGGSTIDFLPSSGDQDDGSRVYSEDDGGGKQILFLRSALDGSGFYSSVMLTDPVTIVATPSFSVQQNTGANPTRLVCNAAGTKIYGTTSTVRVEANATGLGFYGATPVAKPTVTGSRGGNAALASLLTALASQGIITDSSSA